MVTGLKPYSTMKPSGIESLGSVPEHWECRRLKTILQPVDRRSDTGKETLLSLRRDHGVVVYAEHFTRPPQAASLTGFKLVEVDELVVNRLQANNGLIFRSGIDGLISPDYSVFRKKHPVQMRFISEVCRTSYYRAQFRKEATGLGTGTAGFLRLYDNRFLETRVHLPPLPEQQAIVRYLDYVDRRIQRYVRAKRKLIALLEEERQAVVNQAVTRGRNPNVRLKPSGVEWLGEVPEHWEVRRLKTLCQMKSGEGITAESIETTGDYRVYGGNGLRGYASSYTHDGEFALIGRQGALCGNVHIARGKFWATEHAVVATLDAGHDIDWFGAVLTAMNLNQYSIAAAQPGLAVERVLNLHLPVPSKPEQQQIASRLEDGTRGIDAAVARTRRQIELMGEYRTRLVADVVTGKLDVREAAELLRDQEGTEDWSEDGPPADFREDGGGILDEPPEGLTIGSEVAR